MINIRRRAAKQVVIIGGGFQNNKSTARLVKLPRAASTHKITSRCRVICHISWMLRARSNISSCMLQKQTIQLLLLRTAFIASHTRRHKDELLLLVCVCALRPIKSGTALSANELRNWPLSIFSFVSGWWLLGIGGYEMMGLLFMCRSPCESASGGD